MKTLKQHQRDWEELATLDPFWAILSDPARQFGRWRQEEFFATGRQEIEALLRQCERWQLPKARAKALDFGCGLGRLSRPLADQFEECVGLDISAPMIEQARALHRQAPNLRFLQNTEPHLRLFESDTFDFIYTHLVLQHLPNEEIVLSYLKEFVRVLRPGGLLLFQLPAAIPAILRLHLRRHLYCLLRLLGASPQFLYEKLKVNPMKMIAVPEERVRALISSEGARLVDVIRSEMPALIQSIPNRLYAITK